MANPSEPEMSQMRANGSASVLCPTVLSIASSGERNSVALLSALEQVPRALDGASGAASSAEVFAQFDALLAQSDCRREHIDVIAFDQGPGAFTGVRLACSIAQALGFGLRKPLLAISSLEIIAAQAKALRQRTFAASGLIWVARDARMGEVYCAAYSHQLELVQSAQVLPVADAARWLHSAVAAQAQSTVRNEWTNGLAGYHRAEPAVQGLAAGNGFERFAQLREAAQALSLEAAPELESSASALALLARAHWQAGRQISPEQAAPAYVRDKVALDLSEQGRRQ